MIQASDAQSPHLIGAAQRAALRDLGYIGGRRVHLMPPWEVSPDGSDATLLARVSEARPEADLVILALPLDVPVIRQASVGLRVVFAHPTGAPVPLGGGRTCVAVDEQALTDAEQFLLRIGYGPCTGASALALAGFWNSPPDLGRDIVIVLAEPGQAQVRSAA